MNKSEEEQMKRIWARRDEANAEYEKTKAIGNAQKEVVREDYKNKTDPITHRRNMQDAASRVRHQWKEKRHEARVKVIEEEDHRTLIPRYDVNKAAYEEALALYKQRYNWLPFAANNEEEKIDDAATDTEHPERPLSPDDLLPNLMGEAAATLMLQHMRDPAAGDSEGVSQRHLRQAIHTAYDFFITKGPMETITQAQKEVDAGKADPAETRQRLFNELFDEKQISALSKSWVATISHPANFDSFRSR